MIEIYTYLPNLKIYIRYLPRINNAPSQICHHLPIEIEFGPVDMSLANFPGWRLVYQVHHSVQLWWLRNGHHFQCTFYEVRVLKKLFHENTRIMKIEKITITTWNYHNESIELAANHLLCVNDRNHRECQLEIEMSKHFDKILSK